MVCIFHGVNGTKNVVGGGKDGKDVVLTLASLMKLRGSASV